MDDLHKVRKNVKDEKYSRTKILLYIRTEKFALGLKETPALE